MMCIIYDFENSMEDLFQKYLNSTITPNELDQLMNYIIQEENTIFVFEWMNRLWKQVYQDPNGSRPNQALLKKIQQVIFLEERELEKKRKRYYSVGPHITPVLLTGQLMADVWLYEQRINSKLGKATQKGIFAFNLLMNAYTYNNIQ